MNGTYKLGLGLCFAALGSAGAQSVVYNGGSPFGNSDTWEMSVGQEAQAFTLSDPTTVTGATLYTAFFGNTQTDPDLGFRGQFDWTIFADDGSGAPGSTLFSGSVVPTGTVTAIGSNGANETWNFALPSVSLPANQMLWFSVLNTDATGSLEAGPLYWRAGGVPEGGCSAAPASEHRTTGAWAANSDRDDTAENCYGNRLSFQLTGTQTTTPEPTSFALLGSGLIGLVPFTRRKRRK
jgi:hypothetical protein